MLLLTCTFFIYPYLCPSIFPPLLLTPPPLFNFFSSKKTEKPFSLKVENRLLSLFSGKPKTKMIHDDNIIPMSLHIKQTYSSPG